MQTGILLNYQDAINVIKFSACGRYLASAGSDSAIFIWDISSSLLVAYLNSAHDDPIYSLEFSRDNTVLASGTLLNLNITSLTI